MFKLHLIVLILFHKRLSQETMMSGGYILKRTIIMQKILSTVPGNSVNLYLSNILY